MQHLFIINPRAGKKNSTARLMDRIDALRRAEGLDCKTMLTSRPGHAEELARRAAESGRDVRIYACGGDGTLNEVVNGAAGYDNAAVTNVPLGTGNDFLKIFGPDCKTLFSDVATLAAGPLLVENALVLGQLGKLLVLANSTDGRFYLVCADKIDFIG